MSDQTEYANMLAGEAYNCLDPRLVALRERAGAWLRRYNASPSAAERQALLQQGLGSSGRQSLIEAPFFCSYGRHIHLGEHVFLNAMCVILDNNEVHIGDHVMVGPAVQMYTAAHSLQAEARIQGWEVARPIVIEEKVWIGGGAIILPGVRIGRRAVVGAGAVVTRDVPPDAIVAGNPARVVRMIEQ